MSAIKNISLYIPHVFANLSNEIVKNVFEKKIGKVKNIDFVSKMGQDGKPYNSVYIHFEHWYDTPLTAKFQDEVIDPNKVARLVYETPWFWIVLENKGRKFVSGDRKQRIDLGDLNDYLASFTKPESEPEPIVEQDEVKLVVKEVKREIINLVDETKPQVKEEKEDGEVDDEVEDDVDDELIEMFEQMEECEALMEEEEKYLINIDCRYVKTIEDENVNLRDENENLKFQLSQMYNAYCIEFIKSKALSEAIHNIPSNK